MTCTTLEAVRCAVARDEVEREQVYRLRYTCYRTSGAIALNPGEQFSDSFDTAPNQFSFLFRAGVEPLATVRVSVVRPDLGWFEAPSRHVYGDHPAFTRISRGAFVEASRLCFAGPARRDAFVRLVANMAALADLYDAGWLVACPRVEHCHVYQRLFGFRALAGPRRYFGVNFETQLLGIRPDELRAFVAGRKVIVAAWDEALRALSAA
jgi:hypothetical protein